MIRQADIPPVNPGDAISASLLNQIIGGANTARTVTGDESISANTVGNGLGLSVNFPKNKEHCVLVEVSKQTDDQELRLSGGLYQGKIYMQPAITVPDAKVVAGVLGITAKVSAYPAVRTCYVLNVEEFGTTTHQIPVGSVSVGKIVGAFRGSPLVAVNYRADGVLVKITSSIVGAGGKYWARVITGYSQALSTGNLAMPEGLTVPAADDALFLNSAEDGSAGHAVVTGTYLVGKIIGSLLTGQYIVVANIPIAPTQVAYLTQIGGSNGSTASYCTYTYNAYFDAAKTRLAGGTLTVQAHRMLMVGVTAATRGIIQRDTTGTYTLESVIDEYPASIPCT